MFSTLRETLAAHPGDAPAIGGPAANGGSRPWLSFDALRDLTETVQQTLNANGIGRRDRVAIVLPNGPEMAAAFMSIGASAVTAPLNPAYRLEEFEFYLGDLDAKALVVGSDESGPVLEAASRQGIAVIRLDPEADGPAGAFRLVPDRPGSGATEHGGYCAPGDEALILHTSGTTSRPKIVPLLQENIAASARHIGETLALSPSDRCLNVMPLFHIHGLIAAVLSSLAHGASIWCASGFNAMQFFGWLTEARPTWYTAVPTMHQAILARAARNRDAAAAAKLRFVRSSSASLPPQVMAQLEEVFGAPVIESYGMTEASHQMTSNPLPPAPRKAGSVGIAAGPKVAIADETEDRLLAQTDTGEVVISGPNVTRGYAANPDANAKSFFEYGGRRWFRTGDQGRFDDEGYLRITGRLKEIINRGGEKISPLEVDDAIMDHPAVAQAVTFAVPHDKLGEEVAAAVVLREGQSATEQEIRDFLGPRLAAFKTPRKILLLDEIPKGATGKMQRIGLAEKLGLA